MNRQQRRAQVRANKKSTTRHANPTPHSYNRKTRRLLSKKGWDGEPVPGKTSSDQYHADAIHILLTHDVSRRYTR